jgi:hypothetical protein
MDEFTEVVQGVEAEAAQAAGADGWEISAHDHCAEDHKGVHGRVFAHEEFKKLQSGAIAEDVDGGRHRLRRPIGKWNCHHMAYPVILDESEPAYSRERLAEIKKKSAEGVEFRGKRMTLYEATQAQRRLETETRRERGRLACVREAAGSDLGVQERCGEEPSADKEFKSRVHGAGGRFWSRPPYARNGSGRTTPAAEIRRLCENPLLSLTKRREKRCDSTDFA